MDARDHLDHCDVLITGCLQNAEQGRALGLSVALDDDLTALDLLAVSETLVQLAARIMAMATDQAKAN